MKRLYFIAVMTIGMMFFSLESNAQSNTSQNDSTVNAIKIKNLKNCKATLQKQIAAEDKKRNAVLEGVSPETLEKRNERQDSICLELRSELTSVELELKELGADNTNAQIVQQYNNLIHNHQQDSTQQTTPSKPTTPGKPIAPTKPTKPSKPSNPVKPTKKK